MAGLLRSRPCTAQGAAWTRRAPYETTDIKLSTGVGKRRPFAAARGCEQQAKPHPAGARGGYAAAPRIALSFNLMSSSPPEGTGGADPNWEVLADASVVMAAEG